MKAQALQWCLLASQYHAFHDEGRIRAPQSQLPRLGLPHLSSKTAKGTVLTAEQTETGNEIWPKQTLT